MLLSILFILSVNTDTINQILDDSILSNAHVGVCIFSLKNDRIVYEYNGQKLFVPASNQKILTTGAALYYLGANFKYTTRFKMRGRIDSSTLIGDIILEGSGDPTIRNWDFLERWVNILRDLGVHTIVGDVIVDDHVFSPERLPIGWAWHYLDARYGTEVSAFSFNENTVKVGVLPGDSIGGQALVTVNPSTNYVKVRSELKTVPESLPDRINIYREAETNLIHILGRSAKRVKVRSMRLRFVIQPCLPDFYSRNWRKVKAFESTVMRRGLIRWIVVSASMRPSLTAWFRPRCQK